MTTPIKDLKGATDSILSALKEKGITDNEKLVAAGADPAGRKELAALCGCDIKIILELFCNRVDLARIKGISGVYSDLLETAGVDTVKELATRRPDNLHAKLKETNDRKELTQRPPTLDQVEDWGDQAKALPKMLRY